MDKITLNSLFVQNLYRIPDYQRGYAWEEKQWKDFIEDVDALVDEGLRGHYTGTVVVYCGRDADFKDYGPKRLKVMDVVDGQQRLTTACIYVSVILRSLVDIGEKDYEREIPDFLYSGAICKLTPNSDSSDLFYDLLKTGRPNTKPRSLHEHRLASAYAHFQQHIDKQLELRGAAGVAYLKAIYHAITQGLHFTFYTIEEECEIGMTFELMNSRGKDLSVLELLKNYLMHWVSRNEPDLQERTSLTKLINKDWKDTYANIGACLGDEDQCLRIAWTLFCSHTPANWVGYPGFKDARYIPLRNFTKERTKEAVGKFVAEFSDGLASVSRQYASIAEEGHGRQPRISWDQLSDATIEHILPQSPDELSQWNEKWSESDFKECLHDIGNLVLTLDNSRYLNFEFSRKRGSPGISPSYSNSDIRQERKVASFHDWTRNEFDKRRLDVVAWINNRWKTGDGQLAATEEKHRTAAEKKLLRLQTKISELQKQLDAEGLNVDELLADRLPTAPA